MEKQKKMLSKYENERSQYKTRIKELTDENALLHGRDLQGSDEDSPDQLSEIDKQQELMAKISAKNKHIKRLLRDIEVSIGLARIPSIETCNSHIIPMYTHFSHSPTFRNTSMRLHHI